ncbi:MAG: response regulator [Planctomycetes bacterium]|nr:response regulator [Planctomycetota bacterium]
MPRILLIEDNTANLELMSYLLVAFGYTPQTATDGALGLEAARNELFDLIICDIHMPVVDGYGVARQIKADPARQHGPLVAVTALAMVGDREKVLAAGFDGYIAKPIEPETFVQQVETFLRSEKRKAPTPADMTAATAHTPTTRQTVLVVDNMPVNLDLARSILEPSGYMVLTAARIDAGLALAREHSCDLILSDVCMSGETGFDFIRVVREDPQLRNIPFIFLTSTLSNEKDRAVGLALGATRYLFRPIEPDALLAEIKACLCEAGKAS